MANASERTDGGRPPLLRWWLVAACVALIFTLSSIPGLAVPGTFEYRDKIAHALEYGGLSWLVWRAAGASWPAAPKLARGLLAVLAISALAVVDEKFQAHVPGRESSVYDWMADTLGASLAQVVSLRREKNGGGA